MAEGLITLTQDNFDAEVLRSAVPVLVDFWAEWCGPCKMIAPVLAELAADYGDKVKIGKLNIDEQRDLAVKFAITSIPTLLLFKGGEVVTQMVGMRSKGDLKQAIDKAVG